MQRIRKQALTLLEMMVVIFLIGLISSVIGYNVHKSLEEGRGFRSVQAAEQLRDILLLQAATKGYSNEHLIANPLEVLKASGIAKDPDKLLHDGWNELFTITADASEGLKVTSKKMELYRESKKLPPSVAEKP